MAYADLKVGDKVLLTGPGWESWDEDGLDTGIPQVIETVEPGDEGIYGPGATYVTFEGFDKLAALYHAPYAQPYFVLCEDNDYHSGDWKAEVL